MEIPIFLELHLFLYSIKLFVKLDVYLSIGNREFKIS